MKKKVLAFVVAYNAEKTITQVLDSFSKNTLKEINEILIADDESSDQTLLIAQNYKNEKKLSKLKIIKHTKNKGYGGNQKWGYNYAIKNKFDIVVMVHGDAQYPPEYISQLIKPIKENKAEFVFGSRMTGHPLKGGMPLHKYFGNKFLTFIENLILKTRLSEFHSGFRAYSVKALREIPFNYNSDDFHFDSEIIIQLLLAKKKIAEITIPTVYGYEKSYVNVLRYGLSILKILGEYMLTKSNIIIYKKFKLNQTKNGTRL